MCEEKIGDGLTGDDLPGVIEVLKVPAPSEDFDYLRHQIWLCGECAFYYQTGKEIPAPSIDCAVYPGGCRRKSPAPDPSGRHKWPFVLSIEWCGESTPNDKALSQMKAESLKEMAERVGLKTVAECKEEAANSEKG